MRFILEQHFFTSSKPEFTTVGITPGINLQEKIILEQNSLYFLPGELLYDNTNTQLPVKYVYYGFNNKYVLGTASYTGLDSLGRPGNYFFHNIVISGENFYEFKFNPVLLINYFIKRSIFRKSLPDKIEPLELENTISGTPPSPVLDRNAVRLIVNLLAGYSFHQLPVLLRGNQEELLAFFNTLFAISSYEQRKQLFFDSYTYGVSNEFPLLGLPSDALYQQSRNTSLEINLITGDKMISKQIETNPVNETSGKYTVPVNMLFAGNPKPLEVVFELEHRFSKDMKSFRETLHEITLEEKALFFEIFRVPILDAITAKQDPELFLSFLSCYRDSDLTKVFTNAQFREYLIRENDLKVLTMLIDWLLSRTGREYFLLILKHKKLLDILINKNVDSATKKNFFDICRKSIIHYIIHNTSIETCLFFLDQYTDEDFSFIFKNTLFRDHIIELKNTVLIDNLIQWIFKQKQKDLPGLIIKNNYLFNTYVSADKTILTKHQHTKPVVMRLLILFSRKIKPGEAVFVFYNLVDYGTGALPYLIDALGHPAAKVRITMEDIISRIGAPAQKPLWEKLKNTLESEWVCYRIATLLQRVGFKPATPEECAYMEIAAGNYRHVQNHGHAVIVPLIKTFGWFNEVRVRKSIKLIKQIGFPSFNALMDHCEHSDPNIKRISLGLLHFFCLKIKSIFLGKSGDLINPKKKGIVINLDFKNSITEA